MTVTHLIDTFNVVLFFSLRFSWTTGPYTTPSTSFSCRWGLCWIWSIWAIQRSAAEETWHWSATTDCQWNSGKAKPSILYYLCVKFPDNLTQGPIAKHCHCKCFVCYIHHVFPHSLISAQSNFSTVGCVPWTMQNVSLLILWKIISNQSNLFPNTETIFVLV